MKSLSYSKKSSSQVKKKRVINKIIIVASFINVASNRSILLMLSTEFRCSSTSKN